MNAKRTATPKARKPKGPTRDELIRELAAAQMEARLVKEQLEIERRDCRSVTEGRNQLRALVADLERKNATLSGYLERVLQESEPEEGRKVESGNSQYVPQLITLPRFRFPDTGSGITSTIKEYGQTKTKAWHEL